MMGMGKGRNVEESREESKKEEVEVSNAKASEFLDYEEYEEYADGYGPKPPPKPYRPSKEEPRTVFLALDGSVARTMDNFQPGSRYFKLPGEGSSYKIYKQQWSSEVLAVYKEIDPHDPDTSMQYTARALLTTIKGLRKAMADHDKVCLNAILDRTREEVTMLAYELGRALKVTHCHDCRKEPSLECKCGCHANGYLRDRLMKEQALATEALLDN